MTTQRMVGTFLLIGGIVLLIVGMNASHSMTDQISNTFTGRFTDKTTWYIVGGIAAGITGLSTVLMGGRRNNT